VNPDYPDPEPHALTLPSDATAPAAQAAVPDISTEVRARMSGRLWRVADSITAFVSIIAIYGGFLLTEKAVVWLVMRTHLDEIAKHSVVAIWFDRLQVGLALMTALGAFIHGAWALYKQLRSDFELSK